MHYYSKPIVRDEISAFCKGRWVAVECSPKDVGRLFLRYMGRGGPPISISRGEDVGELLHRFGVLKPRTFYASVNVYSKLDSIVDTEDASNIIYASPVWDIDSSPEVWEATLQVAEAIVRKLEDEGVSHSVYVKWSGRGAHVHLHERAFSEQILSRHNPLDVAYAVVEYVCRRIRGDLAEISDRWHYALKVENKVDLKRVFTSPLSLHRQLDLCAVCIKPEHLLDFEIDWAKPEILRHDVRWREYVCGEADSLAERALREVGGYFSKVQAPLIESLPAHTEGRVEKRLHTAAGVGKIPRFQVMALLQAAR
ncbi:MAG: hypothetical protein NZ952_06830, partial [Candidatus Bathyarchaeota archaeon]|nr:hypothetical protein [Candidatus Bathyarchaeota archaeon]